MSKTIKSAETVDTEDDEPELIEFISATSHIAQSEVISSAYIEEIRERRKRQRTERKCLLLETAKKAKAILSPSPKTSSPPTFRIPILPPLPFNTSDYSLVPRILDAPM